MKIFQSVLSIAFVFVLSLVLSTKVVLAQEQRSSEQVRYKLYLTLLTTAPKIEGTRTSLSNYTCSDIDKDGTPEDYVLSPDIFPNGTTFGQIAEKYNIMAQDVWFANKNFFPSNTITAFEGASGVCIFKSYKEYVFPLVPGQTEQYYVEFPAGRPDWEQLVNPNTVAIANTCSTLSPVMSTLGVGELWGGVPIVGVLKNGTEIIAKVICGIPTIPATLFEKSIAWAYPFAVAMEQIVPATMEGTLVPPIALGGEQGTSAIIDFAIPVATGYFICSTDIILIADRMFVPDKRRLFILKETIGCLIASKPFAEGDEAYSWEAMNLAALTILAQQMLDEGIVIRDPEAIKIIKDLEEYLAQKDSGKDPVWVPNPGDSSQCPRVEPVGNYLVVEAILYTRLQVEERVRNITTAEVDEVVRLLLFAEDAERYIRDLDWDDFYNTPAPRTYPQTGVPYIRYHQGMLTNKYLDDDLAGNSWAVMTLCIYHIDHYVQVLDVGEGRVESGLLRTDYTVSEDLIPDFKYDYFQTGNW